MIFVAVIGVALGCYKAKGELQARAKRYRAISTSHAHYESRWKAQSKVHTSGIEVLTRAVLKFGATAGDLEELESRRRMREWALKLADYNHQLYVKYAEAATQPWRPMPPDPPYPRPAKNKR
jgi:hypothetical protein